MSIPAAKKSSIGYWVAAAVVVLVAYDIYTRVKEPAAGAGAYKILPARTSPAVDSPEGDQLFAGYIKSYSVVTYAGFVSMNSASLPPDKRHRLANLLGQRSLEGALLTRQRIREKSTEKRQKSLPTDAAIAKEFGDELLAALQRFERTLPQRSRLQPLIQVLIYDRDELSVTQLETLVDGLQSTVAAPLRVDAPIADVDRAMAVGREGNDRVLAEASGYLSPTQFARLRELIEAENEYQKYFRFRRAQPVALSP
ncbi:MAG: hypothetical protein JWM32_2563 [Verrucomicrobia bacterium]|nr:hypothetical protein [Verrucomicrobiota bacterium]